MIILMCFFIAFIASCIIMYIWEVVSDKVRRIREGKRYANLPTKVLMVDVLNNPVYSELYHDMRQIMADDCAARHVVKRLLMDHKILKYRKERL